MKKEIGATTSVLLAAGLFVLGSLAMPTASEAGIKLDEAGKASMYGDFRLRFEHDWDSQRANSVDRDDRTRARIRARIGFKYTHDILTWGIRFRSGSDESHQSPHITIVDFDDNDTGDADVNIDKWFMKAKQGNLWGWAGRNSFPFWKQNELFWDDDVTPAGLAAGFGFPIGDAVKLDFTGGYFSLPVGMQEFSGNLGAGQVSLSTDIGPAKLKLAAGLYDFDSNSSDSDSALLRSGNGARDYEIWVGSAQLKIKAGTVPLTFGFDYMSNEEDYSSTDPDPVTAANHDQTDGFVASVKAGSVKDRWDWQIGYYYADIEKLAVNSSYAQDDWMRWGSAVETDASDFEGHEFRFVLGLAENMNLVTRLYLVEANTSVQDGNRVRIDYNYKF